MQAADGGLQRAVSPGGELHARRHVDDLVAVEHGEPQLVARGQIDRLRAEQQPRAVVVLHPADDPQWATVDKFKSLPALVIAGGIDRVDQHGGAGMQAEILRREPDPVAGDRTAAIQRQLDAVAVGADLERHLAAAGTVVAEAAHLRAIAGDLVGETGSGVLREHVREVRGVGAGSGEVMRRVALRRDAHRRHVAQEPQGIGRRGGRLLGQRVAGGGELRDRTDDAGGDSRTCGDGDDGGGIRQVEGARRHDPRRKRIVGIGGARRLQQRDGIQHAGRRRERVRRTGHARAGGGDGIEIVEVEAGIEPQRRRDELLGGDGIAAGRGRHLSGSGWSMA